ncbi:MAG: histidine kinase [Paludibacter sp.]|nr:histidine kinase [Paludibacter sp.]
MKYIQSKSPNLKAIEIAVLTLIWMSIFSIPFFQNRLYGLVDWSNVLVEWVRMFSFLVIFVINAYYFVPKLLFQKKYLPYVGYAFLLILVVIGISILLQHFLLPVEPLAMPPMDLGPGMPPMELGSKMPAPMGFRTPHLQEQKSLLMIFTDNLIISILVVGAGTTIKMLSQWLYEEKRRMDVEKEQLKTELALLRHQVSPHFFMNTLNNIHAMIDINVETAKDAIIRLSTLMRYLLYDTAQGHTSLKKEVEFIESYITLMQLRFSKKVTITVDLPERIPDIQIPPMMYISFLENAFKHGVSYQFESFVAFKLEINENILNCTIRNSKHKSKENQDKSYSGIGLTNIRKSLELLFKDDYLLVIKENDKEFEVQLKIPFYENKMLSH